MKHFVPIQLIICAILNILNEVAGQFGMMPGMGMGMGMMPGMGMGMGMPGMGMGMGGGGEDANRNAMILAAIVGGALAIPVVKMMGGRKEVNNKIGRKLGALGRLLEKRKGGRRIGRYLKKYDRPKPKPEDYEDDDDDDYEEEEEHHNHMNQHPGFNGQGLNGQGLNGQPEFNGHPGYNAQQEFNGHPGYNVQQGLNGNSGSPMHPGTLERQESLHRPGYPGHQASPTVARSISPAHPITQLRNAENNHLENKAHAGPHPPAQVFRRPEHVASHIPSHVPHIRPVLK